MDTYPSHTTDIVREYCGAYNITLHFIPPGATDILQPLDRVVFGSLKQIARKIWRDNFMFLSDKEKEPELKEKYIKESQSRTPAINLLMKVWNDIGQKNTLKGM